MRRQVFVHVFSIQSFDSFYLILEFPIFVKPEQELTSQVVSINVPCIHLYVLETIRKSAILIKCKG